MLKGTEKAVIQDRCTVALRVFSARSVQMESTAEQKEASGDLGLQRLSNSCSGFSPNNLK